MFTNDDNFERLLGHNNLKMYGWLNWIVPWFLFGLLFGIYSLQMVWKKSRMMTDRYSILLIASPYLHIFFESCFSLVLHLMLLFRFGFVFFLFEKYPKDCWLLFRWLLFSFVFKFSFIYVDDLIHCFCLNCVWSHILGVWLHLIWIEFK